MFSREFLVANTRGINHEAARNLGHQENSVYAQHAYAIEFWQAALALKGADAVPKDVRAFAKEEIARHQAAIDGVPYLSTEDKRKVRLGLL